MGSGEIGLDEAIRESMPNLADGRQNVGLAVVATVCTHAQVDLLWVVVLLEGLVEGGKKRREWKGQGVELWHRVWL